MSMPERWKIWAALGTIYVVWGSTYLAIKISVRTQPPLLSGGARFVVAGLILAGVIAATDRSLRISRRELASALLLGVSLLTFGVGIVTVAETRIESSVAAMIAGSVPLQVVIWRSIARELVPQATRLAAAVGLVGLALIVVPEGSSGGSTAVGLALMLGASISWSTGSFVSRRLPLPADPFVAAVYEMLGGGIGALLLGFAVGERVHRHDITTPTLLAWLYLVVIGLADRLHGLRVAPAPGPDLAGRDAPVRQSARGNHAGRAPARRAADRADAGRRGDRDRSGVRHRAPRDAATVPAAAGGDGEAGRRDWLTPRRRG